MERSDSKVHTGGKDVMLDIEMLDVDNDHTGNGDDIKRSVSHGIVLRNSSIKRVTK